MIPTDNKSPKVSELIEELQRCDPDDRVRLRIDGNYCPEDIDGCTACGVMGVGPVMIVRITTRLDNGADNTYVKIAQDCK